MKKILLVMSVAILMALFSAPSIVKANTVIGSAYLQAFYGEGYEWAVVDVYITSSNTDIRTLYIDDVWLKGRDSDYTSVALYYDYNNFEHNQVRASRTQSVFIPTLTGNLTWNEGQSYNDIDDFEHSLPPELQPTRSEKMWDKFYDLFESVFGYRPMPGSIYDLLRKLSDGDDTNDTEITLPTNTPTPTPSPTPTPIPVQTIFVPDGNGNTTIIYQYPDPTSGVITQSPYNPNIQNDITINCDCDGDGGGSGTFTNNPQDPYSLDASLLWADGFGVEISENPLTAVNESQQTLNEAAMEYDESVNVLANSFNIIPIKWLTLVGLCGGILIIAGLIRSFIGG